MRRQSVIAVHIALTLLPLAGVGIASWRWLGHGENTRALERTRREREEGEQRLKMLHRALEEAPASAATEAVGLPERQNLAEVLEAIENAAQQSGIGSFRTSTQRAVTPGRQSFEIHGQTDQAQDLAAFLARLEGGSRLLVIHQVEAKADAQGGLAFSIQVAGYHRTTGDK